MRNNNYIVVLIAFASVTFGQGLTIGRGTTFSLGGSELSLPGNYIDSGTFAAGSGTVVFNGATSIRIQTIASVSVDTFNNLIVNKPVDNMSLEKDIAIKGKLTITAGDLYLLGHTITMETSAVLSETPGNTVKGSGKIGGTLPISAGAAVNPFGLGATLTSTVSPGSTEISRGHVVQTVGASTSILRYFDISPAINSGLGATLVFHYDTSELKGHSESDICLYRSNDTGKTWAKMGGTVDSTAHTVILSGISGFSRWTLVPGDAFPSAIHEPPANVPNGVPRVFALSSTNPNHFRGSTQFRFTLKDDSHVTLKIFDFLGHEIRTLVNDDLKAGVVHRVAFNTSALATKTYVCRLSDGKSTIVKKVVAGR